jgi:hypothetical protein
MNETHDKVEKLKDITGSIKLAEEKVKEIAAIQIHLK